MNTLTPHELDTLTFNCYKKKRRMELQGLVEKAFEDKVTEEWKILPYEEKLNYYKLAEKEYNFGINRS
jgi:hypothetical protein